MLHCYMYCVVYVSCVYCTCKNAYNICSVLILLTCIHVQYVYIVHDVHVCSSWYVLLGVVGEATECGSRVLVQSHV